MAQAHHLGTPKLTTFIAVEIEARIRRAEATALFVLNLPISGLPTQRDDHLLTAILTDQTQFLRYLRFPLAEELGWPVGMGSGWELAECGYWVASQKSVLPRRPGMM